MMHHDSWAAGSPATEPCVRLDMRGARILALAAYALLNALYLASCLQRTAIPGSFFNELQGDIGLKGSQVTRVGSIFLYCYAYFQIFAGMLVDRFGGKRSGIFGGIALGAGLILFATAKTAPQLYASRAATAVGSSFLYLCVVKISHILFPPRKLGALVSISMALGFAGGILGTMPAQRLSQAIGWRSLFLGLGAAAMAVSAAMVVFLFRLVERPRKSGAVSWRSVADLFNERGRLCFVTYNIFSYPVFFALQAIIGQKFIQDFLGYPAPVAANFTMLLTMGSAISCVAGAPLIRALGNRRRPVVIFANTVPVAVSLLLMACMRLNAPAPVFLLAFATMSLFQLSAAATSALMGEITDSRTIAFTAAVRNFFPYLGAGLIGAVCGRVLDSFATPAQAGGVIIYPPEAYMRVLHVMLAFALVGLAVSLGIPETRGRRIWRGTSCGN